MNYAPTITNMFIKNKPKLINPPIIAEPVPISNNEGNSGVSGVNEINMDKEFVYKIVINSLGILLFIGILLIFYYGINTPENEKDTKSINGIKPYNFFV
jgi:hypothetical protein